MRNLVLILFVMTTIFITGCEDNNNAEPEKLFTDFRVFEFPKVSIAGILAAMDTIIIDDTKLGDTIIVRKLDDWKKCGRYFTDSLINVNFKNFNYKDSIYIGTYINPVGAKFISNALVNESFNQTLKWNVEIHFDKNKYRYDVLCISRYFICVSKKIFKNYKFEISSENKNE